MSILNALGKVLGKEAKSLVRSEVRSEVKKKARSFLSKWMAKSEEEIHEEIKEKLGFDTNHYTVDKNQIIKFKSSSVFVQEFLTKHPKLIGKLVKDEESGSVYFDGQPWTNQIKIDLINLFAKTTDIQALNIGGHFDQAIKLVDVSDFNASKFKNHFQGWNPKDPSIINQWLISCFGQGIVTEQQYATMLFRKWIIGTARRAMLPGTNLDGCLTFTGPAGVGKTQFFRQLLPPPFDIRTGEVLCNIKDPRKFAESILGKTIACFDELSVLESPKVEQTFKQLLSSENIDVRFAYRRDPQRYALRQGFGATTNELKFIKDRNLSRRLWIIELNGDKRLDFDWLIANREALWQEAVYWAEQGESCFLSESEQKTVELNNEKYYL